MQACPLNACHQTVAVVDGDGAVGELVARFVGEIEDCRIVATATTGWEAVEMCRRQPIGILILDSVLPELNGADLIAEVRRLGGTTRFVVFSGSAGKGTNRRILSQNPDGFVQKCESLATLKLAVHAVATGSQFLSPKGRTLLSESNQGPELGPLTSRERSVVQLVAEGHSSKAIAERLDISVRTVEHHREHIRAKLRIRDVASLVRYAISHDICPLADE